MLLIFWLFTCGRRPAGLLATLVVVVVVVAVVVVFVGGGNNFYTWAFQRAHVWPRKLKRKTLYIFSFLFQKTMYGFDAHVWSKRGVTPYSEISTPFQNHGVRLRLQFK